MFANDWIQFWMCFYFLESFTFIFKNKLIQKVKNGFNLNAKINSQNFDTNIYTSVESSSVTLHYFLYSKIKVQHWNAAEQTLKYWKLENAYYSKYMYLKFPI